MMAATGSSPHLSRPAAWRSSSKARLQYPVASGYSGSTALLSVAAGGMLRPPIAKVRRLLQDRPPRAITSYPPLP